MHEIPCLSVFQCMNDEDHKFSNVLSARMLAHTLYPPPPYRAIGYSYTYRIYVFQVSQGIALYPPYRPL